MTVMARYGSDELKRKCLEPLCRGDFIASFGVTEPSSGSDVASIKMRAVEDGDSFVPSGSKESPVHVNKVVLIAPQWLRTPVAPSSWLGRQPATLYRAIGP